MNQAIIQEVGKSQRLEVLNALKRTEGLSVRELAEKLGLSYMGVKAHCLALDKQGYLDTWRRAKDIGRPELIYRLTKRTLDLFPRASNALTVDLLQAAADIYGPNAPEKLLHSYFQELTVRYKKLVKGKSVSEKVASLVQARVDDGYMSELQQSADGNFKIIEHHHPMFDLLSPYPILDRLETEMFTALIGKTMERKVHTVSGLYRAEFTPAESK